MSENKENKELKQLIRQRGSLKARLTLFKSYVEDLKQMEIDNDTVDEVLIELRQRLEKQGRLGTHNIYECPEFLKLTPEKRGDKAREHKLCFNCLLGWHFSKQCKSKLCRTCKAKHHTLLHINKNEDTADVAVQGTPLESMQSVALSAHTSYNGKPNRQVLLSTAIVNVIDNRRNVHKCRVILDSA
ncbi:hypothetical protein ILUMI_04693 [Ignelater luminosus]|uniref:Uncharacterized protein n=1 Tax=Ignelater luminosus TaxID=2038154 RepID=A0A8K0DDD3_IGNLU|nr:hypothetical protein ILUMI_04693 [Ignelater luminosus]